MTKKISSPIQDIALIGLGSVGAGLAAKALAKSIRVRALDPGDRARVNALKLIEHSWPSLRKLGLTDASAPDLTNLEFFDTIQEAVSDTKIVIENVPEDLDLKRNVISEIDAAGLSSALILSSAGGIAASEMQIGCNYPERVLVMHPFNPSHLIPLVEIVPGKHTSKDAVQTAQSFARSIGKFPIVLEREMNGHMVNRLQFALVREAIRCMVDGIASAQDIDAAVRYGLAPRWLLMGGLQTVAMAGGPGGMRGILEHAGPAMEKWWATEENFELSSNI